MCSNTQEHSFNSWHKIDISGDDHLVYQLVKALISNLIL